MSGLSDFLADAWLEVLRGNAQAGLSVWVQLHTGDPGPDGTDNVAATSTRNVAAFVAADGGVLALDTINSWTATATESVPYVSAWSAGSAGNFLFGLQLAAPLAVVPGTVVLDTLTMTLTPTLVSTGTTPDPDPLGQSAGAWTLVFREEFDGSSLDTTKWYGWLPEELPSNSATTEVESTDLAMSQVVVSGGQAVGTAIPGVFPGAPDPLPSGQSPAYKSWMISTMPRHPDHTSPGFAQAFAYWEARFRLGKPDGSNLTDGTNAWPALWGICADGLWGDTGAPEWDMFEQFDGSWRFSHWKEAQPDLSAPAYTQTVDEMTVATGFHTLGMYWTTDDVFWFLDGAQVAHYNSPGTISNLPAGFMTNMAVKVAGSGADYSVTYDYIRIWQKAGAPGKPTITSVTPGDSIISVTFGAVSGAVSYRAFAAASRPATESANTQRHSSQTNISGSTTTLVIPNVVNGKHYRVFVEAIDSTGRHSACSDLSTEVTAGTLPPNAPTIGTATAGNASASVTFTPAGTGPAATSYVATSTPGSHTGTAGSSPITVFGLTNGTAYTFTVHATNAGGNSAESAASNSATPSGGGGGTILLQDSFDRANGALGTADTGGAWSFSDPFTVASNEAKTPAVGFFTAAVLNAGAGHTDGTLTCTVDASAAAGVDCGIIMRYTDDTHLIVLDMSRDTGDTYFAKLFVRNGSTTLTGISSLWTFDAGVSHVWDVKCVLSGSTITVSVDTGSGWTALGSGTDTTSQAGTKFGIAKVDASADASFDNFLLTT